MADVLVRLVDLVNQFLDADVVLRRVGEALVERALQRGVCFFDVTRVRDAASCSFASWKFVVSSLFSSRQLSSSFLLAQLLSVSAAVASAMMHKFFLFIFLVIFK